MKKKFIIFTLCFTLIFSSINYKKSYADMGVISTPMLGTIATLALASGIVLTTADDVQDLGRLFYNKYSSKWDNVVSTFNSSVTIAANKVVSVGSEFLQLVKSCFDDVVENNSTDISLSYSSFSIPHFTTWYRFKDYCFSKSPDVYYDDIVGKDFSVGNLFFEYYGGLNSSSMWDVYYGDIKLGRISIYKSWSHGSFGTYYGTDGKLYIGFIGSTSGYATTVTLNTNINLSDYLNGVDIPYTPGSYSPDGILNKDKLDVYVPGNTSSLVGVGSNDVIYDGTLNPPYDLPNDGIVDVPSVDNPSISVDSSISFPKVEDVPDTDVPEVDVPSDGVWSNVTDYIIDLVVPSDSYWTDTFGGLHANFINSFPMIDMSSFNSLSVNGKPFPNIDINIMGSKGRVVNGDTVNSIVDWLRPIISGFVFLCLMFFNYRKLYKLIRNSEPFEGIGKVENHAN